VWILLKIPGYGTRFKYNVRLIAQAGGERRYPRVKGLAAGVRGDRAYAF